MDSSLRDQISRLRAILVIQAAETEALFLMVAEMHGKTLSPGDSPDTFSDDYLQLRKKLVQESLLALEDTDPAMAAKIQQILESAGGKFHF